MKNFKTFDLAIEFYKQTRNLQLPRHLRDQLHRASSSISLNLAEGSGRFGKNDQKRFYHIAMGSLRECQAILELEADSATQARQLADKLGAHLYKLIRS